MRALLGLPLLAGLGALLYRGPSMRSLAVTPATVPAACGRHCGVERWSVKTLSDRDRGRVNFRPRPTTVAALAALERPAFLPEGGRAKPVERTTFVLRAYLAGWQPENDGDIHLILADPDQQTVTMIAEIPDPECAGACASGFAQAYAAARDTLSAGLERPNPEDRPIVVEVTGVGFFDRNHGQIGAAPNFIELHPVLSLRFVGEAVIPATDGHRPTAPHSRAPP